MRMMHGLLLMKTIDMLYLPRIVLILSIFVRQNKALT